MTQYRCPSQAELLLFVDAGLAPEQLDRIERHLRECPACLKQVGSLRKLVSDLAAPLSAPSLDVSSHVAAILSKIDAPAASHSKSNRWLWFSALSAAAAAALVFVSLRPVVLPEGEFTPRGGPTESTLSRDVGVQIYEKQSELRPLQSGSSVKESAAFTAGVRNLAQKPAHLLLFAVDSRSEIHWVAPEYTESKSNPSAIVVSPSKEERLLPNAVVFDDLVEGTLRIVALIANQPMHVADVEGIAPGELNETGLTKHFPHAELRQISIQVIVDSKP